MIKAVIFDMYETLITHYQSPLYFSPQMAADAGISEEQFQAIWRPTERERSIGKMTFENVVERILKENHCYSEEVLNTIAEKRKAAKLECFRHLHPEVIPLLKELKEQGIHIGLISNCFSEEAEVIKKSELFPYFDAPYLSYEQGVQKPDEEIFFRCMNHLSVKADECVYVGDGGSLELETATKLGMKAVQAVWYFEEGNVHPGIRNRQFLQAETPLEILKYVTYGLILREWD